MFKKPIKVSNEHAIKNKDVKKMREKLVTKQGFSEPLADKILKDENYPDDSMELKVAKLQGSKVAYYARGQNPLFFCSDGDKLTTNTPLEPTIYLLFQQTLLQQSLTPGDKTEYDCGAVRFYLKQNVEKFLFNGADLMWPGVLSVSSTEFKQNVVAVVYAHKSLVSAYISTLGDIEKAQKGQQEEETKDDEEDGEGPQS